MKKQKSKEELLKELKEDKAINLAEFLSAEFEQKTVKRKYRKFKV